MSQRARTIFLGTGEFAVPIVAALAHHPLVELLAVVTAPRREPPRAKQAGPPVATWAADNQVQNFRPDRLRATSAVDDILSHDPELLVLADYGQIVPAELLALPHGALNLHPSLLPLYRGAAPIPAAILAGDAETGVSLMQMDAGLDSGPIVAQWRMPLDGTETAPNLERDLADLAARLLTATLEPWLERKIMPEPQDESAVTLTRPLRREDGRIDTSKTAVELERQVRAYQPWPGSFLENDAGRIVVWRAHPDAQQGATPETGALVRTPDGGLALATADGLLVLDEVQPAGGRRMTGQELLRGRPHIRGSQ